MSLLSKSKTSLQNLSKSVKRTLLADDFFYDNDVLTTPVKESRAIDRSKIEIHNSYGFDSHKRSNLHYLDEENVVTSVGNLLTFINLQTLERTFFPAFRSGGIGAIAVHPSRKYIAVAEVSISGTPLIYILEYPSLKLYRICREGTERAYSNICFNTAGDKLASVGSDPDYMLTIWKWKDEQIILRSKAFSQDVYRVQFAADNDGILTSSGMGHIKFWKMSSTFTGLKLQGYLGKFGATELSDICAFVQLPDGKVLSSTEMGNLLLWDGGMIKCEISGKGKKPCHQGRIEVVTLAEGEIFTSGEDGYVRVWDLETIDNADVVTSYPAGDAGAGNNNAPPDRLGGRVYEMEPIDEILIGKEVKIKSMVRSPSSGNEFLVQDMAGNLFKLDAKKRSSEKIISFHSGAITGADLSPLHRCLATLGEDGTLRLHNYSEKTVFSRTKYGAAGSSLTYLPQLLDGDGSTVAAGFADGVLRIITHDKLPSATKDRDDDDIEFPDPALQYVFKPHTSAITSIRFSLDCNYMATTSDDSTVFFFYISHSFSNKPEVVGSSEIRDPPPPFARNTVKFHPMGFITLDQPATSLSFSPDNHINVGSIEKDLHESEDISTRRLVDKEEKAANEVEGIRMLISTGSNNLITLVFPPFGLIDNSASYELNKSLLNLSSWKMKIPERKIVVQSKHIDAKKKEQSQTNLIGGSEDGEKSEAVEAPIKKEPVIEIDDNSTFNQVMYLEGGYFLASITNQKGETEVRSCKFDSPDKSRLLLTHKVPISLIKFSSTGKYLLIGSTDGMVAQRKYTNKMFSLKEFNDHQTYEAMMMEYEANEKSKAERIAALKQAAAEEGLELFSGMADEYLPGVQWLGFGHNSDEGKISAISTSFDDAFLVTAGHDGGIVVWRNNMEVVRADVQQDAISEQVDEEDVEISVKKAKKTLPESAEDILDQHTYSIQEAKVKSERDREVDEAEIKKQRTRNFILDLRHKFLNLLEENASAQQAWKIHRDKFLVDPGLIGDIEKETRQKMDNVRKELEWISQKESIGLEKLNRRFLDDVITEHIEIKAFKTESVVSTFRTLKSNIGQDSIIQSLLQSEKTEENANELKDKKEDAPAAGVTIDSTLKQLAGQQISQNQSIKLDNRSKLEARKQLRNQRAAMWKELMDEKPDENYEDPRDVAAIRYAEQHMGDYKLKTGEKYIVPEEERVDADKKKKQLTLLKESIFGLKETYNTKVITLRERKQYLIRKFHEYMAIIEDINKQLTDMGESIKSSAWAPKVDPHAYPEKRYKVDADDIAELQKELKEKAMAAKQGGDDFGLGGFGGGGGAPAAGAPVSAAPGSPSKEGHPATPPTHARARGDSLKVPATLSAKNGSRAGKSALEMVEYENNRILLKYKKEKYTQAINQAVVDFDQSVDFLMKERVLLEGDITFADIKLLLLYKEWVLLKEFEKYDNTLAEKLILKRQEQYDIDNKIKECQEKLNGKKYEIESIIKKEKDIQDEFQRALGDSNKYEELLTKILKRKIKRSKKKTKERKADGEDDEENQEEEEEEEESDDDLDSSFDSDSIMSDSEMDAGEEICPADCDPEIFSKVLELRERKLDDEDMLAEIQKAIEAFKKENESLIKKEKVIRQSLKTTESEIQDFQTQKQQKLNELDVVIPLRLHQLQYLERNALPADLTASLVFVENGLKKLKSRIKELQQEKIDIKKNHKELKKMHVSLINSRKEKQSHLQEYEMRALEVQMLKFGKVIDLEKLERMGVNKNADELREKIQKEDQRREKEIEEIERDISDQKEKLTDIIKENTSRMEKLVSMSESKHTLEHSLDKSQSSVTAEYSGPQKKDVLEREKLINLVQHQNIEIEELKNEIEILIRKPLRALPAVLRRKDQELAAVEAPPPA